LGGLKVRNNFENMALNGRIILLIDFLKKYNVFGGCGPDLSDSVDW
jgi:hypothetical protein